MYKILNGSLEVAAVILALVFVSLVAIGMINSYSPVPFWDMWDAYIGFYLRIRDGSAAAWWMQHNEHRIVASKLLFWIDLSLFQGRGIFLFTVNFLLLAASAALLLVMFGDATDRRNRIISCLIVALVFSWVQNENLTWAFQSQIFLAQLLPLMAFFLYHKSLVSGTHSIPYFLGSITLATVSVGTMANGLLALPLLFVFSLIYPSGWLRSLFIGGLSIASIWAYSHNYVVPPGHGSLLHSLLEHPVEYIEYVFTYLGGPLYFVFGEGEVGLWIARVAGAALALCSAFLAWAALRQRQGNSVRFALLLFIVYVGGTAFGTAGGRLALGLETATASRYMTSALLAWAAMIVLLSSEKNTDNQKWVVFVVLPFIAAMIPLQFHALESRDEVMFERYIAALALEMQIPDTNQIGVIYPSTDTRGVLRTADLADAAKLSIFGLTPIRDVQEQLGKSVEFDSSSKVVCEGHVEFLSANSPNFLKLEGWIFDSASEVQSELLLFLDGGGRVSGFGMVGKPRPDVARAINDRAYNAGFKAYISNKSQGEKLFITSPDMNCRLPVEVPEFPYRSVEAENFKLDATVSDTAVLAGSTWTGNDFWGSAIPGLKISGSFVTSDADTGSITLELHRGDRLLYRSGPTAGRQWVDVLLKDFKPVQLPLSSEWTVLDFDNKRLPETFTIRLRDDGNSWGEWSAIGVLAR